MLRRVRSLLLSPRLSFMVPRPPAHKGGQVLCPRLVITTALAMAITAVARPLAAQRVSLSPTLGVYIPTTELVKAANGQEFKQEIALAVGGRLGVNFTPRFGIVTSVSYVPSSL